MKTIVDPSTGIVLTPGNGGDDCLGNGEHSDSSGVPIELCCDECSYYAECFGAFTQPPR